MTIVPPTMNQASTALNPHKVTVWSYEAQVSWDFSTFSSLVMSMSHMENKVPYKSVGYIHWLRGYLYHPDQGPYVHMDDTRTIYVYAPQRTSVPRKYESPYVLAQALPLPLTSYTFRASAYFNPLSLWSTIGGPMSLDIHSSPRLTSPLLDGLTSLNYIADTKSVLTSLLGVSEEMHMPVSSTRTRSLLCRRNFVLIRRWSSAASGVKPRQRIVSSKSFGKKQALATLGNLSIEPKSSIQASTSERSQARRGGLGALA